MARCQTSIACSWNSPGGGPPALVTRIWIGPSIALHGLDDGRNLAGLGNIALNEDRAFAELLQCVGTALRIPSIDRNADARAAEFQRTGEAQTLAAAEDQRVFTGNP